MGLAGIVREVIEDGVGPDPKDIATKVMERVPFGDEREYLAELMPDHVRQHIKNLRHSYSAPDAARRASSGKIEGKWAAVRSVFQTSYYADGEWFYLGDLTSDKVEWLIADYGKRASENAAYAEKFQSLRNLMRRHKAETVSDLPVGKVEEVMS